MNYIYHISSIATTFGPLSKVTILGQKCMAILGIRHTLSVTILTLEALSLWSVACFFRCLTKFEIGNLLKFEISTSLL